MRELPQSLKDWKARHANTDVIVTLYEISVTDAITVRLIEGNPLGTSLTLDSEVYIPAAIQRGEFEQSVTGELGSFPLTVSNIDGIAGGYIERYELEGRRVTIKTFAVVDDADEFVETWTIQDQAYNRKAATITLGYGKLFKRKLPWRRYERPRCLHDWENRFDPLNGCGFPSDQFKEDSTQSFKIGGVTDSEQRRQFGWYTLNILKASSADVNITDLDALWLSTTSSSVDWSGANRNGPYVYKKITGDFDVYTRVDIVTTREGGLMGILCQEDLDGDSWLFYARTRKPGEDIRLTLRSSIDGSQEPSISGAFPDPRYLRMRRVGNVFTLYHAVVENEDWIEFATTTITMTPEIRIGLAIGGGVGTTLAASFEFFRFTAGGPSTCDRTKEGADGCRVKDWIRRIFAFDGIPRR